MAPSKQTSVKASVASVQSTQSHHHHHPHAHSNNGNLKTGSKPVSSSHMTRSSNSSSSLSTGSSTSMANTTTHSCSCGHAHAIPSKKFGAVSKTATSTAASINAWKKQKELRDFALIDRLLARIFWLRFYEDAARLYSTRLTLIAKERLPFLLQNIIASGGGPGWACANVFSSEDLREFFRLQIQIDLREVEDRVWHISSEWTYTAIRRMAISNGFRVPQNGLRATDLLNFVPLLEAMCQNLENASPDVYQFHPIRPIAATFLSLPSSMRPKSAALVPNHVSTSSSSPQICAHHPTGKCAADTVGSSATVWGSSLYRIFGGKHGESTTSSPTKDSQSKGQSADSPAGMLFDALFPPGSPMSPATKAAQKRVDAGSSPAIGDKAKASPPFSDAEMAQAQAEMRSLLALGLSRSMIVLFQTANEFNIRAFGEYVNMAFGGCSDHTEPKDGTEADGEWYGGCECCVDDWGDAYDSAATISKSRRNKRDKTNPSADSFYDLWNSLSPATSPAPDRRKSIKRAKRESHSGYYSVGDVTTEHSHSLYPAVNTARVRASRYRGIFSPRPGAGLKAWDAVLHYEAVIREEEEEKQRVEKERQDEQNKYGLKCAVATAKHTPLKPLNAQSGKAETKAEGRRAGKAREDLESHGRGGGVLGWNSCHEEDVWERDLDNGDDLGLEDHFGFFSKANSENGFRDACRCRRIAMRYLIAEECKEDGNAAFKSGDYLQAVDLYTQAHKSEPRIAIYLLNRAMALLKLNRFHEAELDCTAVLRKHRCNAKALWRRAKARRTLSQATGDIEKLIAAEQDLLDFLAILPNSVEGVQELASVRAELCPCVECTSANMLSMYCSTSTTQMSSSCFNRNYRPAPTLLSATAKPKSLEDSVLSCSADVFGALPKGWLTDGSGTAPAKKPASGGLTSKVGLDSQATFPKISRPNPWFTTTPTGASREHWLLYVQDASLVPDSVSIAEDRLPLRFVSEHDIPAAIIPGWDVYRIQKSSATSR